jgi:HAD superfamily hydrolase (TIGR01509 family)
VAVEAVVFDVGETLVDETNGWARMAEAAGLTPFTLMAAVGATIAERRPHWHAWQIVGADPPTDDAWGLDSWYPDAKPCLARLRALGFRVGAAGNTPASVEDELRPLVDVVGSAAGWGLEKPDPAFFAQVAELVGLPPERIAYVGDRVDNDVEPALAAGLVAVHVRRGPWGHLQQPPSEAIRIRSLDELPGALP